MDRRFEARLGQMLAQAEVPTDLVDGFLSRLEAFVRPFAASLASGDRRLAHTLEYLTGLLSRSSSTRHPRGSPTSTTRSVKASRSSSGSARGTTHPWR